jgi:hypothetical protein
MCGMAVAQCVLGSPFLYSGFFISNPQNITHTSLRIFSSTKTFSLKALKIFPGFMAPPSFTSCRKLKLKKVLNTLPPANLH